MQTENRPQAAGPRDLDRWHPSQAKLDTRYRVMPDDQKRERRNHGGRFGPLPGEVYPDEAHFGSFN